uniref:Uncharacterized protein n=1 Tax=Amphimedon queenslandica TaxID=400682 RepID=A0A1X7T482_AMPQE
MLKVISNYNLLVCCSTSAPIAPLQIVFNELKCQRFFCASGHTPATPSKSSGDPSISLSKKSAKSESPSPGASPAISTIIKSIIAKETTPSPKELTKTLSSSATNVASGATTGSQTTSSVTMPTKRPFKPRGTVPPVAIKKKGQDRNDFDRKVVKGSSNVATGGDTVKGPDKSSQRVTIVDSNTEEPPLLQLPSKQNCKKITVLSAAIAAIESDIESESEPSDNDEDEEGDTLTPSNPKLASNSLQMYVSCKKGPHDEIENGTTPKLSRCRDFIYERKSDLSQKQVQDRSPNPSSMFP